MSYNIRYDNPADGVNSWTHRRDQVAGLLRFHQPDVAGLQEALLHQVRDLNDRLPEYAWIGVGRDDGEQGGELVPVFYNRERFGLQQTGHFWLAENPESAGYGWDAACKRIVTWGQFEDRFSGRSLFVFNTHFDHAGQTARLESSRLLLEKITEICGSHPVIVTGDFNTVPGSKPYQQLTGLSDASTPLLLDSRLHSRNAPCGPEGTFNGFKPAHKTGTMPRIDHIFSSPLIRVLRYNVLTDNRNGRYPSDHLPVFAELLLP